MSFVTAETAPVSSAAYPTLSDIQATARRLAGRVLHTPVWHWRNGAAAQLGDTEVWLKLELFQETGTFKLRGALNCIAALPPDALARGVVAASAGNHAIAVAHAARLAGTTAKVAMARHASPARIAACRDTGAEVLLVDSVHRAFELAQQLVEREGRAMVHPYDGPRIAEGTATIGLELMAQVPGLDAVIVPVGGGGLCAGIAAAVRQLDPRCRVFGVEPFGADAMYRSFQAGRPMALEQVDSVADSLGAPYAMDYSYGVCRRFVEDIVRVSDDALRQAMYYLYRDVKLATEPATAAATAALLGPLRDTLAGRRVAVIACGANFDPARFGQLLEEGRLLAA
ncbi:serine/threonine dehydratase [Chitiniphilus shinanonensis]|uniref:Threonine dehydratase n=1 Tax=Chitiniphilus shinanonensis TaxID=553088 RepID=F8WSU7_9NEIS|nr:threonine/serine dehydratase [Chitiniphilus shinanonensis]BAK53934.1 threonine dehydratase [Chitiniphilus shinanonensis]GLS04452.1 serine/threonine dehydratase [Chitiniphilus shinanonensis]